MTRHGIQTQHEQRIRQLERGEPVYIPATSERPRLALLPADLAALRESVQTYFAEWHNRRAPAAEVFNCWAACQTVGEWQRWLATRKHPGQMPVDLNTFVQGALVSMWCKNLGLSAAPPPDYLFGDVFDQARDQWADAVLGYVGRLRLADLIEPIPASDLGALLN